MFCTSRTTADFRCKSTRLVVLAEREDSALVGRLVKAGTRVHSFLLLLNGLHLSTLLDRHVPLGHAFSQLSDLLWIVVAWTHPIARVSTVGCLAVLLSYKLAVLVLFIPEHVVVRGNRRRVWHELVLVWPRPLALPLKSHLGLLSCCSQTTALHPLQILMVGAWSNSGRRLLHSFLFLLVEAFAA